jgi:hypothetical protein
MPQRLRSRYLLPYVLAGALLAALVAAPSAGAAGQTVKCKGNGDFCGASVSIAGGASNRVVTINLTDTDLKRVATRVIPAASKGAFSISKAKYKSGGSQYQFTLNAVQSNPKGARIILLFSAGAKA